MRRVRAVLVCLLVIVHAELACGPVQKAAASDPQKCERDPNCASKNSRAKDCSMQCVDNIECMRTCEEMQGHR